MARPGQLLPAQCRYQKPGHQTQAQIPKGTTRSSSTGALINGNAGRPKISSASSLIQMEHGAVSIAARMALTPFEPPTVIVFQIGVSSAAGSARLNCCCACRASSQGQGGDWDSSIISSVKQTEFYQLNAVARSARVPVVGISSLQRLCATIADSRAPLCTRPDKQ